MSSPKFLKSLLCGSNVYIVSVTVCSGLSGRKTILWYHLNSIVVILNMVVSYLESRHSPNHKIADFWLSHDKGV